MRPHSYFLGTGNGKMAGNVGKGDKEEDRKLSGTPDKLGRNTIFSLSLPGIYFMTTLEFQGDFFAAQNGTFPKPT